MKLALRLNILEKFLKNEAYQEVEKNKADYDEVLQKVEQLKERLKERDTDTVRAFRNETESNHYEYISDPDHPFGHDQILKIVSVFSYSSASCFVPCASYCREKEKYKKKN